MNEIIEWLRTLSIQDRLAWLEQNPDWKIPWSEANCGKPVIRLTIRQEKKRRAEENRARRAAERVEKEKPKKEAELILDALTRGILDVNK